jgi:hypothetical protein
VLTGVAEEISGQNVVLTPGQPAHQVTQCHAVADRGEVRIVAAEKIGALGAVGTGRRRGVERVVVVGVAGRQGLENRRRPDLERGGQVLHRRRPPQSLGQLRADLGQLQMPFLQAAVDVYGPAGVPEVLPQFAEHGGHEVGEERRTELGFVAVDRLDQGKRGDLSQVVTGLSAVAVAVRQSGGEGQVELYDPGP